MSTVDVVERDVMAVSPDAMASRFLTRWLISPGKQFVAFLRLFPSSHIDKNSKHDAIDNAGIVALTAG